MEATIPMQNCLLQQMLRSLCTPSHSSSTSSKWVYAVFWRILPRNYPPPMWDHGGGILDRAKGNRRNWILVWEDGFCDFCECEGARSGYIEGYFGAEIFFKMSHEVYNFGEGVVGKIAANNSHKWVFRDSPSENNASFISSLNTSLDLFQQQPRAWEAQFKSGIQTISVISVREGVLQLGSFDKVAEDLNLVINIQRKFSYLHNLRGIYAVQRPYLQIQHPHTSTPTNSHYMIEAREITNGSDDKHQLIGLKRRHCESPDNTPSKSVNTDCKSRGNVVSGLSNVGLIPPLLPSMSCNFGARLVKMPSLAPSYDTLETVLLNNQVNSKKTTVSENVKIDQNVLRGIQVPDIMLEASCVLETIQEKEIGLSQFVRGSKLNHGN